MCGIAGIVEQDKIFTGQNKSIMECMLDLMKHRGPDDRGIEDLGSLVLGHLRLSILDLSELGHQPMSIDDGKITITYNGEIYNYIELREELKKEGAHFFSETDTEVILQAYRYWGMDCFKRFNGMWALAIWDADKELLVLSRDRVGIKPLYWCDDGEKFAFASELKALLAYRRMSGLAIDLSLASMKSYLALQNVDGLSETFVKNVYRFEPGHVMLVQRGKVSCDWSYWNLPENALAIREERSEWSTERLSEELYHLMGDAVSKHLRSDVPVGVCLSGGLDSSCIAAMSSREIKNLKTFTAWFGEGKKWNETDYADCINDQFNLKSYKKMVEGTSLLEMMPKMLWYLDEPTLAMGVYTQWHVMEMASGDVTVVMDGQGGDELFAGYDFYASRYLCGFLSRKDTNAYERTLNAYLENYGPERAKQLDRDARHLNDTNAASTLPKLFPGCLDNLLYVELTQTRLPALLRYEDRLSMAFSIESRVPLLDYRLIEFAFSIDESLKIDQGWSKHIMRTALDKLLPSQITWRKDKKGYPTPFDVWSDGSHKQAIREMVSGHQSRLVNLVGRDKLKRFFLAWDQGKKDHQTLWRLLSMEIWLRTFVVRLDEEIRISSDSRVQHVNGTADIRVVNSPKPISTPPSGKKPKICHIGGSHTVHVSDTVEELDRLGYEQCVIGYYPVEKNITPKHVPAYSFPFRNFHDPRWKSLDMDAKIIKFFDEVFSREKPDIVHGHSLYYSCLAVYLAKEKFGINTIMQPWSFEAIDSNEPSVEMYSRRCIEGLDFFADSLPTRSVFKRFQAAFGNLPDEKLLVFRPPVDLSFYEQQRQITKTPSILSARVMGQCYRQDLLVKALPALIEEFPDTKVTLIIGQNPSQGKPYFDELVRLSRKLQVDQYCTFIPRCLSKAQFAELIKSHNIAYSIATHDGGFGTTTIQAAYSGAITIVRDTNNTNGILDHNVNALRTRIDERNIRETLLYAARNLEELQQRFISNNRNLITQGKEYMIKNLTDCYQQIYTRNKAMAA